MYLYCDNNPITRRDDTGDLWGVAVGAFVIGAATSLVNQIIFGDKNDTVASIAVGAITAGVTTAMGVMGGGAASTAVGMIGDYVSDILNGDSSNRALKNACINGVIGVATACFDLGGTDYIAATKNYQKNIANIADKASSTIEIMPYHLIEARKYTKSVNNILKVNTIGTVSGTLASNVVENTCNHVGCREIGWQSEYDPKTGIRKSYQIYDCY